MLLRIAIPLALALGVSSPAVAEISVVTCPSQQELEQVIQSEGELVPEGCRTVTVTAVDSPVGELCVADLAEEDPGVIGAIAEAVAPMEWWIACTDVRRP